MARDKPRYLYKHWIKGFERACVLLLGTGRWRRDELAIRRRVTTMLFGRKRTKPAAKKRR